MREDVAISITGIASVYAFSYDATSRTGIGFHLR